jgi:hypothetical protein
MDVINWPAKVIEEKPFNNASLNLFYLSMLTNYNLKFMKQLH